ncbi:MAG: TlpA family protein disulfide reductase [Caldilineaceae bacterium]|nr:TlpA family protein disulfide reductase [Caldilineaceae bacterium]HRJ43544.1 TlpA disulfide reductase family protein [Caldilineaceae bacterium]
MNESPTLPPSTAARSPRAGLLGLGALILLGLLGWGLWQQVRPASLSAPLSSIPAPEVGHPAPDFALPALDGPEVRLSDLRGKVVVLNFWATWCPPCRREMPALEVIWQQHNRGDVVVLGIDQGESAGTVSEYVRQNVGVTFPLLLDRRQDVGDLYLVRSLPTTFFIDGGGIIREIRIGGPMELDYLNRLVRALLND